MPKLSISFNAYTVNANVETMTIRCIESFRPHVDEVVFSEDGGIDSPAIRSMSDQYLWHKNVGSCRCTNIGWEAATGDYVINAQTDTRYVSGNLRDLCIPDKVTTPQIVGADGTRTFSGFNNDQHSEFFCVPRALKEQYGMLDERLRTYMQDFLYCNKVMEVHQVVDSVVVRHFGHGTINQLTKHLGWDEQEAMRKDFQTYVAIVHQEQVAANGGMPIMFSQYTVLHTLNQFMNDLRSAGKADALEAVNYLANRFQGIGPRSTHILPTRVKLILTDDGER